MDDIHTLEAKALTAAYRGHDSQLKAIIETRRISINCVNADGKTLLHLAAKYHHLSIVEYLLEKGAEPNISCRAAKYTPLHEAALVYNSAIMRCLLKAGSHPIAKTALGWTIMHFGATCTPIKSLKNDIFDELLTPPHETDDDKDWIALANKALFKSMLDTQTSHGMTPLHLAVLSLNVLRVEQLLKAGARVDLKDNNQRTSLDHAIDYSLKSEKTQQFIKVIVHNLIKSGSSITCVHAPLIFPILDCLTTSIHIDKEAYQESLNEYKNYYSECILLFKNHYRINLTDSHLIGEDYFKIRGNQTWVYRVKWLINNLTFQPQGCPQEISDLIRWYVLAPILRSYGITDNRAQVLINAMIQIRYQNTTRDQTENILPAMNVQTVHESKSSQNLFPTLR